MPCRTARIGKGKVVGMTEDLRMRTIEWRNPNDEVESGVVVKDMGGENVCVDFGEHLYDEALLPTGSWVPRADVEDITDDIDLAREWGLIEDDEDEDDEDEEVCA
jgi:hypothetical protein